MCNQSDLFVNFVDNDKVCLFEHPRMKSDLRAFRWKHFMKGVSAELRVKHRNDLRDEQTPFEQSVPPLKPCSADSKWFSYEWDWHRGRRWCMQRTEWNYKSTTQMRAISVLTLLVEMTHAAHPSRVRAISFSLFSGNLVKPSMQLFSRLPENYAVKRQFDDVARRNINPPCCKLINVKSVILEYYILHLVLISYY